MKKAFGGKGKQKEPEPEPSPPPLLLGAGLAVAAAAGALLWALARRASGRGKASANSSGGSAVSAVGRPVGGVLQPLCGACGASLDRSEAAVQALGKAYHKRRGIMMLCLCLLCFQRALFSAFSIGCRAAPPAFLGAFPHSNPP